MSKILMDSFVVFTERDRGLYSGHILHPHLKRKKKLVEMKKEL